jgi:hypothetical protein
VTLFEKCAAGKFEPYTSDYALGELEDAPDEKRGKMIALIEKYNIAVLSASDEAKELADRYISDGALPQGSRADAEHIAVAVVGDLDIIVSLNFRHILRPKTIELTRVINKILGYNAAQILLPMEVIDSEKTRLSFWTRFTQHAARLTKKSNICQRLK